MVVSSERGTPVGPGVVQIRLLEKRLLHLFQDRAAQHLVVSGLGLGFLVRVTDY